MLEFIVSMATSVSSLSIFAVTLVVIYGVKSWLSHPSDFPPMPRLPVPILGHMPFLTPTPTEAIERWRETTGDLFTIYLGGTPHVVINGHQMLHEMLVKRADVFSNRPCTVRADYEGFNVGIVENNGEAWKEQRSVSLSILRSFGMGKNVMAENIADEVDRFVKELSAKDGKPLDVSLLVKLSVSNVISGVLLGNRFDYKEPHLHYLIKQMDAIFLLVGPDSLLNPFPFLRFLPGDLFGAKALGRTYDDFFEFFRFEDAPFEGYEFIRRAEESKDDESSDNYTKAYLREMHKRSAAGQVTYLDKRNLLQNLANLFLAGTDTTSSTIMWALVFALRNPNVQTKLYNEIEEAVGTERAPEMNDKPRLNYVNAFIMETQRLGSIVPLNVFHSCSQTTQVGGYTIPKDAVLIPNLDSALKDPKDWKDPLEFRPERFLDEENKFVANTKLVTFSLGRRVCMGESLAKMELFLFLTAMFQRFEILPEVPNQPPSMDSEFGITVSPRPFLVKFKSRNN